MLDEDALIVWNGAAWISAPATLQNMALLGVGTTADTDNPFAAKLNKALWSALYDAEDGNGDLRYTLNKEAAGKTLSLLMQSNWSGRAELGLIGNDDLSLKVSPDGAAWKEALTINKDDGRVRFRQGIVHPESGALTALYVPAPVREIWRLDASRAATPRTYTVSSVSGTTLTLSAADVNKIFLTAMRDNVAVRIWNTSKSPAQSAWVDRDLSTTQLRVTDASHIATWTNGETLRLGDPNPTGANTLQMVALDISNYLYNQLGAVFPQKGVFLALYVSSTNGSAGLSVSGTGAFSTAMGGNALSDGLRNSTSLPIPTSVASPISNSNLLFLREELAGTATDITIAFARILGVYV